MTDTDWRAADPPVCPECGCAADYATWERRDLARSLATENARLRARLADIEFRLNAAETAIVDFDLWMHGDTHEDVTIGDPEPEPVVTDAMVEAALSAFTLNGGYLYGDNQSSMRAAINAAMNVLAPGKEARDE